MNKSKLIRQLTIKNKEAEKYLDQQSINLQPLVTDCIINSNSIIEAKEMFDKNKEQWMKKYDKSEQSFIKNESYD